MFQEDGDLSLNIVQSLHSGQRKKRPPFKKTLKKGDNDKKLCEYDICLARDKEVEDLNLIKRLTFWIRRYLYTSMKYIPEKKDLYAKRGEEGRMCGEEGLMEEGIIDFMKDGNQNWVLVDEKLLIFFFVDEVIGINKLRKYMEKEQNRIEKYEYVYFICKNLSKIAKEFLDETGITVFLTNQAVLLCLNFHMCPPVYKIIKKSDKHAQLKRQYGNFMYWPKISKTDSIVKLVKGEPGDVLEFTRCNLEDVAVSSYYRYVTRDS